MVEHWLWPTNNYIECPFKWLLSARACPFKLSMQIPPGFSVGTQAWAMALCLNQQMVTLQWTWSQMQPLNIGTSVPIMEEKMAHDKTKNTFLFFEPQAGLLLNPLHGTAHKLLVSISHVLSMSHIRRWSLINDHISLAARLCRQDITTFCLILSPYYF